MSSLHLSLKAIMTSVTKEAMETVHTDNRDFCVM